MKGGGIWTIHLGGVFECWELRNSWLGEGGKQRKYAFPQLDGQGGGGQRNISEPRLEWEEIERLSESPFKTG